METVFWRVIALTAWASAAAVIILMVRAAFYRVLPKAFRFFLWGLLLVRMLLPFAPPSGLSLYNLPFFPPLEQTETGGEMDTYVVPAVGDAGAAAGSSGADAVPGPAPLLEVRPSDDNGASVSKKPDVPGEKQAFRELSAWPAATGTVWAAGAMAMLLFGIVSYVRTLWRLRSARAVEHPVIAACIRKSGLRRKVKVYCSGLFSTPVVCGLFSPRILLPEQTDMEDYALLAQVVNHELVHIRRWDALFKMLFTAALSIHWFNPLLWYCWRLAMRDMELSVDEQVLERSRTDIRKLYARSLVSMAAAQRDGRPGSGILSFGESGIHSRVQEVLRHKKITAWGITGGVTLIVACCVLLLTGPRNAGVRDALRQWEGGARLIWTTDGQSRELLPKEAEQAAGILTGKPWEKSREEALPVKMILRFENGPALELSPGESFCQMQASWQGKGGLYRLPGECYRELEALFLPPTQGQGTAEDEGEPIGGLPQKSLQGWWEEYLCYAAMTLMEPTFGGEFSGPEDLPMGAMEYVWYQLCRREPEYAGEEDGTLSIMPREKAMEYAGRYLSVTDERFVTEDVNYDAGEDGIRCLYPYRLEYARYSYNGRGSDAPEGSPRQNLEDYALQSVSQNQDGSFTAVVEDYGRISYWDSRDKDSPDTLWYFTLRPGKDGTYYIASLHSVYAGERKVTAEGNFTLLKSIAGISPEELVDPSGYGEISAVEMSGRFAFVYRQENEGARLITVDPETMQATAVREYPAGSADRIYISRASADGTLLLVREGEELVFYDRELRETGRFRCPDGVSAELCDVDDERIWGAYIQNGDLWLLRLDSGESRLLAKAPNPSEGRDVEAYSGGRFVLGGTGFLAQRGGWAAGYGYHLFELSSGEKVRSIDVHLGYNTLDKIDDSRLTVITWSEEGERSCHTWDLTSGDKAQSRRVGAHQNESYCGGTREAWFFAASGNDTENAVYRLSRWDYLTGKVEDCGVTVRGAIPVILAAGNGRVVFGYSYGGQTGLNTAPVR